MEGWSGDGAAEQHSATPSGSLPADHSSQPISSTGADFRKSNESVYMHTVLRQSSSYSD